MTDNGASSYHRFLKGDMNALEELVGIYGDALVRFAYCFLGDPYAAEDVMEESFAALIVRRKSFTDGAKLKAYLFKIARNKCMDALRTRKRYAPLHEESCETLFGDAEQDVLNIERNKKLYGALQQLPKTYRETLDLVYLEGFSVAETAAILHKNRKQIYNLLARSKRTLKEILEKEGLHNEKF